MAGRVQVRCTFCGSDLGYTADVTLKGMAHYNWLNDPVELNVNAMMVVEETNFRCVNCKSKVQRTGSHRGAKRA